MFLIIGANGSIGSQLVKQLTSSGEKVRVLVRDKQKAEKSFGKSVDVVTGDIGDPASLDRAFQGVARAFVLTSGDAIPSEKHAFAAAKKAGVNHIVKLSTAGAQKGSPIRLASMHGESEEALKASGVPFTVLQPTFFTSNLLGSAGTIKGEGKLYGAFKTGRLPVIDPEDIAATAAAVLKNPTGHEGKTLYLTGPEAVTHGQIAEKLGKALGKSVSYVDLPASAVVESIKKSGAPSWYAEDFGKMSEWFASDQAATVSDAVEKIAGRKPRTVDAWIADNAKSFK